MTGSGSDPRLLEAAWANEQRIAAGGDAAQARKHRAEDYEGAKARAREGRPRLVDRLARMLHHGRSSRR